MKTACKTLMIISIILCILSMILAPGFAEVNVNNSNGENVEFKNIYFESSSVSISYGSYAFVEAYLRPSNADYDISYYSNSSALSVVDLGSYCKVYGHSRGYYTLYASANGLSAQCMINVY